MKKKPVPEDYRCAECGNFVSLDPEDVPRIDDERVCWACKDKQQKEEFKGSVLNKAEKVVEATLDAIIPDPDPQAAPVVEVDATVLTKVIQTIETEARLYMKLILAEGKGHFEQAMKQMDAVHISDECRTEQGHIIDFFRGYREEIEVWKDCPVFRAKLIQKVTERWGQKTP